MKWKLIANQTDLEEILPDLASLDVLAMDLEADSMYHYHEKICLIQILGSKFNYLIDPLSIPDITPLLITLAKKTLLFHACDYDLHLLKNTWDFVPHKIQDTAICAKILGIPKEGLQYLLKTYFDIDIDKKFQKANWSIRPLKEELLEYAAGDTLHLISLRDKMFAELEQKNRIPWAEEFFEVQRTPAIKPPNENAWRIKDSNRLYPKELGALKILWEFRDKIASKKDLPAFKIIANPRMIEIAKTVYKNHPIEIADLKRLPKSLLSLDLSTLVNKINKQLVLPNAEQPQRLRPDFSKLKVPNSQIMERLKNFRADLAQELNMLEPTIANKAQLIHLAQNIDKSDLAPEDVKMQKWQFSLFSSEIQKFLD